MNEWSEEAWHRIDELLDQALDRPPAERSAFLDAACAGEPDARAHVEALIAAEEEAPDFLDRDAAALLTTPLDASASGAGHAGRRVGPYRLIEEIGRGGMSRVYCAERVDGAFEQEVAVKLLPLGLDTPAARQRFRLEQQVLADLQHPHIARLLDGGVTDDDVPYLVMERVDGQPITAYCDAHRLPVRERLKLLAAVGKALQYAHRNLVVHRDLKPDNIFVTEDGTVKLLDFGIAKLMDAGAVSFTAPATQAGVRPMTPAYAAPEQVRGAAISAATDVYQLGVLAYELLTGHRPFASAAGSRFEMERAVLEEPPTVPSTAVTRAAGRTGGPASMESTPEQVSAARDTSAERLQRALRGDLDAVVLHALAKDPDARYASAEAFIADMERYLEERPVKARQTTRAYRFRKFIQRHRPGVAAAAAFVVLSIVFVTTLAWQQQQTAQQRDRAQAKAQEAERVTQFMMGLFEASDPEEALGDTMTAQALLQRGVEQAADLGREPNVQARMYDVVGRIYQRRGQYDRAADLLQKGLSQHKALHAAPHADVAQSLRHLAELREAQSNYAAAESLAQASLRTWRAVPGNHPEEVADATNYLANMLLHQDDSTAASFYRQALRMYRDLHGPQHTRVALILGNLGLALQEQGLYDQAESVLREALSVHNALNEGPHPDKAIVLRNLGIMLREQGRLHEADTLLERNVEMRRQLHDSPHPQVSVALSQWGDVLADAAKHEAAESAQREALSIVREVYGADHPFFAILSNNLGHLLMQQGDIVAADTLLHTSLRIRRAVYGAEHPRVATVLNNLSELHERRGAYRAADSLIRQSLQIRRAHHQGPHPRIARALTNLGDLRRRQGRHAAAERSLRDALTVWRETDAEPLKRTPALTVLGQVRTEQGQLEAAAEVLREALEIRKRTLGTLHWKTARTAGALGRCLAAKTHYARAETLLVEAYETLRTERGPDRRPTREVAQHLVNLYEAWGKADQAASYRQHLANEARSG
ncbi:MAG: tetratricopeptide repeat protein [Bacteroidetes bacterium]|jgi:serine/threonine-protein kinase|nr:tetratricopeptide repeat protein [Bacteroidota bacterium]